MVTSLNISTMIGVMYYPFIVLPPYLYVANYI